MSVEAILMFAIIAIVSIFLLISSKSKKKSDVNFSRKKWKPVANTSRGKRKPVDAAPQAKPEKNYQQAKVERVVDGDTVVVSASWRKIKIRLDSVDCPEQGQHWGDTARFGLIKLIGGQRVYLEEHGIDCYERTLATIYVQNGYDSKWINVNERMVTLGHAWVMRRFYDHLPKDRQDQLNRLERWAKSKKVGLWKTPNPVPPWKWRSEG